MRILFVIQSMSTAGGAEKVLADLAGELSRRGHALTVASFDGQQTTDFYQLAPTIKRVRLGRGATARLSAGELARHALSIRKLLGAEAFDLAVGFMHSAFAPLAFAAVGQRTPVIASEHTSFDHYRRSKAQHLLMRAAMTLCSRGTATLESVRLGYPPAVRDKMVTIENPLVIPDDRGERSPSFKRLLFVANFRPEKEHATLLKAFAKIADAFPGWELRLVGGGELLEATKRLARDLALESRIVFTGEIMGVEDEYVAADLFVISSSYESFGLATAEALARGVPAVGFADCPGTNQLIVDDMNGLLVAGADRVDALATGMSRLMADQKLRQRLGAAGPDSVSRFSLDRVVDRWEALFREVQGARL